MSPVLKLELIQIFASLLGKAPSSKKWLRLIRKRFEWKELKEAGKTRFKRIKRLKHHHTESCSSASASAQQSSHWDEWIKGSAIDPGVTKLNLVSLDRYAPFERLFYSDKIKRLNTGRLPSWILNRYSHLEQGGWWCSGVDPVTGTDDLWGCFKPDHPRIDTTKGKYQKYEHPYKAQATLFALKATDEIRQKVAKRYGVEALPTDIDFTRADRGFWSWVKRNNIPIVLTEGCKKAAALLSLGFAAIALPGIWGGYRKNDGKPTLIPQLEYFASKERKIYFAFDQDEKRSTRQTNRKAVWHTAKLLKDKGCAVSIIEWEPFFKGVDDLIVVKGDKHFAACYEKALPFDDWMADGLRQLTYKPALRLGSDTPQYLTQCNLIPPPNAKLICLKAPKNSGKTEWLVKICADAQHRGQKVVILTHRTQLGKALCKRFGIEYVDELKDSDIKGIFGFGLCFDSLRRNSSAQFNPEDWHGAIVILDECEQSIWHLLNARTEVAKYRVQVLRNFQQLIQNTLSSDEGKVYLSDADLSDVSIDYVRSLTEFPVDPWIAVKEGNPTPWNVTVWEKPEIMLEAVIYHIHQGGIPLIFVDGQKAKSKWGTRNLEAYLKKIFPHKKILRIDAESVADPTHPAYGCMDKLDEVLKHYDIVIASPTIETGVSIDIKGHFTSDWDFAQGVIPVASILQRMARLRESVPRHVCAKSYGIGRIGNGSASPRKLLASEQTKLKAHIKLLAEADTADFDATFQPESIRTWTKMAARINLGMMRYRHEILRALVAEGHTITPGNLKDFKGDKGITVGDAKELEEQNLEVDEVEADVFEIGSVKDGLTATRDEKYAEYRQAIANAPNPDDNRLKTLKKQKSRTQHKELLELRKGELSRLYAEELISDELIELDDDGEHSKIQLHYYLTHGREHLSQRDKQVLEGMLESGQGQVFLPDASRKLIGGKVGYLEALGVKTLLEQGTEWTNNSQILIDLGIKVKQYKDDIKAVLGCSIREDYSPVAIAQKLLRDCLGLEFSDPVKRGSRGNQVRHYQPVAIPELREKIFEVWLQRDEAAKTAKAATEQVVEQVVEPSATGQTVEQVVEPSATGQTVEQTPVDSLISLFERCENQEDFRQEVRNFAPESKSLTDREELIEGAMLFFPLETKRKLQNWWTAILWEVRDFWKALEQSDHVAVG